MMRWFRQFAKDERGVVLIETLLAIPVLTLLALGILEFGNMMWQRQQLQSGVKDAARYWARCRPLTATGTAYMPCDLGTARLIAFTGHPDGGVARVPGWDDASELTITPATPPTVPNDTSLVTVTGTVIYDPSPFFGTFYRAPITMSYWYQTRYLGW